MRLAHRRLAIIDLSAAGRQPLVDDASGHVIVFNGEIYNYAALRESLKRAGCTFTTAGDAEVLLKAYRYWGADMLQRLRGMLAYALWDLNRRELWVTHDPWEVKPYYYCDDLRRFAFASQVRALRDHAQADTGLDGVELNEAVVVH